MTPHERFLSALARFIDTLARHAGRIAPTARDIARVERTDDAHRAAQNFHGSRWADGGAVGDDCRLSVGRFPFDDRGNHSTVFGRPPTFLAAYNSTQQLHASIQHVPDREGVCLASTCGNWTAQGASAKAKDTNGMLKRLYSPNHEIL